MGELPRTLRLEELRSGQVYGYVLPNLEVMLKSGMFPGTQAELARKALSGTLGKRDERGNVVPETYTEEHLIEFNEFGAALVAWMVRTEGGSITYADGEDVKETARQIVMGERPVDHYDVGTPVTYTPEQVMDPEEFPQDDFEDLLARGLRNARAPRAVTTAPKAKAAT